MSARLPPIFTGDKIELLKLSTEFLVDSLRPRDYIGVVSYSDFVSCLKTGEATSSVGSIGCQFESGLTPYKEQLDRENCQHPG